MLHTVRGSPKSPLSCLPIYNILLKEFADLFVLIFVENRFVEVFVAVRSMLQYGCLKVVDQHAYPMPNYSPTLIIPGYHLHKKKKS